MASAVVMGSDDTDNTVTSDAAEAAMGSSGVDQISALHGGGGDPIPMDPDHSLGGDPDEAPALCKAAQGLVDSGDYSEAIIGFRRAIALDPAYAPGYAGLGRALEAKGHRAAAIAAIRRALAIDPGPADVHADLGRLLRANAEYREAALCWFRAIDRAPDWAGAHLGLGIALRDLGLAREAVLSFERAKALAPDSPEIALECGQANLLMGDLANGFLGLSARLARKDSVSHGHAGPEWTGEDLSGKTILVYADGRLSETLMLARFVPELARRGANVLFECQAPLVGTLSSLIGVTRAIPRGDIVPPFDVQVPLVRLPALLEADSFAMIPPPPYLKPPKRRAGGASRLPVPAGTHLKIGIAWGGRSLHATLSQRMAFLENFLNLLRMPGVTLYSLQRRDHAPDLHRIGASGLIVDLGPRINDFQDTAALLSELDLIISVDTAVAHLAAAMGRPVWLLLPYIPPWQFGLGSEKTAWYPSMRLFRQQAPNDWTGVFSEITRALTAVEPTSLLKTLSYLGRGAATAEEETDFGTEGPILIDLRGRTHGRGDDTAEFVPTPEPAPEPEAQPEPESEYEAASDGESDGGHADDGDSADAAGDSALMPDELTLSGHSGEEEDGGTLEADPAYETPVAEPNFDIAPSLISADMALPPDEIANEEEDDFGRADPDPDPDLTDPDLTDPEPTDLGADVIEHLSSWDRDPIEELSDAVPVDGETAARPDEATLDVPFETPDFPTDLSEVDVDADTDADTDEADVRAEETPSTESMPAAAAEPVVTAETAAAMQADDEGILPLPSAFRDEQGRPRFSMPILREHFRDPDIINLCRQEADFGGYEYAARRFLDDHLLPGDVFLDVGAHWGVFAMTAASRWPGEVKVLAVEPEIENLRRMRHWIDANGMAEDIEIIAAAVGEKRATAVFRRTTSMRHRLVGLRGPDATVLEGDFDIPVASIDEIVAARPEMHGRRVFLKIDVEGSEPEAIAGAEELLDSGRVAAVIWSRGKQFDREPDRERLLDMMRFLQDKNFVHLRFPHDVLGGAMVPFLYGHELCNVYSLAKTFPRKTAYPRPPGPHVPPPRPSSMKLPAGARAQWTELMMIGRTTDAGRWADPAALEPGSEQRASLAASALTGGKAGASVLDIGAGLMKIANHLDSETTYMPLDLVARAEDAIVLDLNQGEIPQGRGRYGTVVLLHVLEFLHDPASLLGKLATLTDRLVVGYVPSEVDLGSGVSDERDPAAEEMRTARRSQGYFNDWTQDQLRNVLLETGWQVVEDEETILGAETYLQLVCTRRP